MAEVRGDIETYRRALGLVLDVVNYHQYVLPQFVP